MAVRGFLPCFVSYFLNLFFSFFFSLWEMTQALGRNSAPNEAPLGARCLQAGDLRVPSPDSPAPASPNT